MDTVTIEDLKFLSTHTSDYCVSVFMPTHRSGPRKEQDPIRLKNLLKQAEERLEELSLPPKEIELLLEAPRGLLDDFAFWRHQSDGLALFFSKDILRSFCVPLNFTELTVVSNTFHVKPLLPMLINNGHFYLLSLSQKEVRLMEGNRIELEEAKLEKSPPPMDEALGFSMYKKESRLSSEGRPAVLRERSGAIRSPNPEEDEKKWILSWLHVVDDCISDKVNSTPSPLVVACLDYLFPLFKDATSYSRLVEEHISCNPEEMSAKELHEKAWALVEPIFKKKKNEAAARYKNLIETDRTSAETETVVLAALHGRVDTLFVDVDVEIWGRLDEAANQVTIHQSHEPGDIDLIDLAAVHTLLNGGIVYPLSPEDVESHTPIEAIFRY